jgi:two-component sensor histidine kinase
LPENRLIAKSLALCYTSLGQFNQAGRFYLQTLKIDSQIFKEEMYLDVQNYLSDYNDICDFLIKVNQYKKAETFVNKFFRLNRSMVNPIALSHAYLIKFKIDSASGNYFSAINSLQQHVFLNDSLFNDTKSNQISELQIKYETAQKEKSIMSLQSQGQKQKLALQRVNVERNLVLCVVLALLVITCLIYNGFRRNKKSNLKLQHQQSEINLQNISLHDLNHNQQLLLNEKEWLIREIHHRVKNNLQTTMSLLNMQTAYLSNIDAIAAISSSQRRMYAMALVHQELYHSANLASINMKVYMRELVNYLCESFGRNDEIKVQLFTEAIQLNLATAIPIGLIINEAVTNCIMYAFPNAKRGTITIKFTTHDNEDFILSIEDDGIGLPKSINYETTRSLGLNLIKGLTDQIQGSLEIQSLPGMLLKIRFNNIK